MLLAMHVIARPIAAAAIGFGLSVWFLAAQATHFPSSEDLRHIRALSQRRLFPGWTKRPRSGHRRHRGRREAHIWFVDRKQSSSRQLTYSLPADKKGEHDAEWMPDGGSVLFLAHRGEHTQLFRLPMQGSEAHPYELKIMAGFVEGKTDRFKAIVSGAPVIDQQSEYGTEDSS
jgi:hypothetical protein